jgi:sarcinarray family protein
MKTLYAIVILTVLLALVPGEAGGKSIKAYFNGEEATVTGVVLHPGEAFVVDLYMTPDLESYAYAEIDEPGVTRAYDRLEGDAIRPAVFKLCNASSAAHYRWVMAANENWIGGIAPLNIYYQLNDRDKTSPSASGLFTVVEAYIAPGETEADVLDNSTAREPATASSPGLITLALGMILATMMIGKEKTGLRRLM